MKIATVAACVWISLAASQARTPTPIRLFTHFDATPPAPVLEAAQAEVARLMAQIGLEVLWRSLPQDQGEVAATRLAAVNFTGACDAGGIRAGQSYSGPLG